MLIRDKKHFMTGLVMALGFFALFFAIMSPLFDGRNGLEYADDIFNKLSKGSAYFVPGVMKNIDKVAGKQVSVTIKIDKPEDAQRIAGLLTAAGAKAETTDGGVKVDGDLNKLLTSAAKDADYMYKNDGEKVKSAYGYDEKKVLKDWGASLNKIDKALQEKKEFDSAKVVSEVNRRLIETSYNYYKVESQKVTERVGTMAFLLIFYVVYTMWWGFALYHLFEGLGLTAKKAKVKKEV